MSQEIGVAKHCRHARNCSLVLPLGGIEVGSSLFQENGGVHGQYEYSDGGDLRTYNF